MNLYELENKLNSYLEVERYNDNSLNGLQVEGRREIKKICTGVTASLELFKKAIEEESDGIIVHHGILWRGMDFKINSYFKARLKILLQNEISLFAYHLPLDAHFEVGNNIQIGNNLGFSNPVPFGEYKCNLIGYIFDANLSLEELLKKIKNLFGEPIIHIPCLKDYINKIAIVSGGAQDEFLQVIGKEIDAYLTGEISEYITWLPSEINCHFIAAGHYRTEVFGIKALTEKLKKWGLEAKFIDLPHIY